MALGWSLLWALIIGVTSASGDPTVDALAHLLRDVTGQLEKFNTGYLPKLDVALNSNSAKMASLEASVRGMADRASAWDNIQNHMAVWTDQSRTMERKLDLLNRCHEKQDAWESKLNSVEALNNKLVALDKKINAMTRLEFKVEQVSERVEEVDSKMNWVKKRLDNSDSGSSPIVTEFAGRGLLSSLIKIETKLDNISHNLGREISDYNFYSPSTQNRRPRVYGSRVRQTQRPTVEPEPGIHFSTETQGEGTPCLLTQRDSRLLQDVSGKVDLVFDRITDPDNDFDYFTRYRRTLSSSSGNQNRPSYLVNTQDPEEDMERQNEDLSTERLFARFWKSIFSPIKKMNRRFRSFEVQMESLHKACNSSGDKSSFDGDFGAIIQKKLMPLDDALREEMEETRVAVNDQTSQIQKVSQAVGNVAYVSEQVLEEMGNQFTALRAILIEHFGEAKSLILQYCGKGGSHTPVSHPAPPVAPAFPTAAPRKTPIYRPVPPTQQTESNRSGGGADCSDIVNNGTTSGIYKLLDQEDLDDAGQNYYKRYCDMDTDGGGWTVIQRRGHYGPPYENFTRDWKEYKYGFGNMELEYWWGNDFISRLVSEQEYNIRFDLWDFDGNYAYAEYLAFGLTGEDDNYRLRVSGYRGNASDSFSAHNGYLFSTFDRDNDEAPECCPCAPAYGGGWWFYSCFESNLNGEYHTEPNENDYYRGIIWELWLGDYSLKATEIKIRPSYRMSKENDAFPTPYPGPPEGELPLRARP